MNGIHVFDDAESAADACARRTAELIAEVLSARENATVAFSGGTSPALMFERLAEEDIDWTRVHLFQVDERVVAPDDPQSNYRLLREKLLLPARVPATNVHRIRGELAPAEAAARYGAEIREWFGIEDETLPVFDIVHRGIGDEGHTASLFPGDPLIANQKGIAAMVAAPKQPRDRVTLLAGPLAAARHTLTLASGEDKAEPVYRTLRGEIDPLKTPAQIGTRDNENAEWYLDRAAARLVSAA